MKENELIFPVELVFGPILLSVPEETFWLLPPIGDSVRSKRLQERPRAISAHLGAAEAHAT